LSAAHCLAWEIVSFDAMHASKGNSDVLVWLYWHEYVRGVTEVSILWVYSIFWTILECTAGAVAEASESQPERSDLQWSCSAWTCQMAYDWMNLFV
jgi:hypothetical protein